jgi:hypothetical protein
VGRDHHAVADFRPAKFPNMEVRAKRYIVTKLDLTRRKDDPWTARVNTFTAMTENQLQIEA